MKESNSKNLHKQQNQNAGRKGEAAGLAGPQEDQTKVKIESKPKTAWCKRDGHNRICLACGQNVKSRPETCPCEKHKRTFQHKQNYNRKYWRRNKRRLLQANRVYRASNPAFKRWAQSYHRRWYLKNRVRKLAQNRAWGLRNLQKRRAYLKRKALQWYHAHWKRARANNKRYYRLNRVRKNSRRNELLKAARRNDPGRRILYNFRCRLSTLVRKGGSKKFSIGRDVLLYTGHQLRAHLEKRFTTLMSWANYGNYWEVDHIQPCDEFDLTILEQARECFALKNLRPLPVWLNRSRYHTERRRLKRRKCIPNPISNGK